MLNKLVTSTGSVEKAKKPTKIQIAHLCSKLLKRILIDEIIVHYKTTKSRAQKPPTETVKKILDFYNWDNISCQLLYKNLTRKINDHLGVSHHVPVCVMEVTLKLEYPNVKLSRSSFEKQCPKNICLRH